LLGNQLLLTSGDLKPAKQNLIGLSLALLFSLHATQRASDAAGIYEIIPAGPANLSSIARDLNDHGVMLGVATDFTNVTYNFTSQNGIVTVLQSPSGTNEFQVTAINNNGEIIGTYQPPPVPTEGGGLYYFNRAFLQTATTNLLFGEGFPNKDSAAVGINDRGDVVGIIGNMAAYFRPGLVELDDPNISNGPQFGGLNAINENRMAVGHFLGSAAFWTNMARGRQTVLADRSEVFDINNAGQMVGQRIARLSVAEPISWVGTNATVLGSHISFSTRAQAINEHGAIVGMADMIDFLPPIPDSVSLSRTAMLWTNGVGLNLNSLVQLTPREHYQLTEAVAVNESGQIAATLIKYDGTSQAVILRPTNRLDVPPVRLIAPSETVVTANSFTATISPGWPNGLSEVRYVLHRRLLIPGYGGGDFWEPARWYSRARSTNFAVLPNTETTFSGLSPGQYALCAVLKDNTGVEAYLPPVFFTIAGPPSFTAARRNFRGVFEYAVDGGSGYMHTVEESTNLIDWVPAIINSLGGGFDAGGSNDVKKFFRARVTSIDPEHFGVTAPRGAPPENVSGATFRVYDYANGFAYILKFTSTNTVEVQFGGSDPAYLGHYTYRVETDRARLNIDLPELQTRLEFQLQWAIAQMPNDWRCTEISNGQQTFSGGRFFTSGLLLRPYVPPFGTPLILEPRPRDVLQIWNATEP
jgi:uncharacterized membrane protein